MFVSSTFVGMMIGAFVAGYVGDRLGRRYSYQLNLAVFGLASIAACFAPDIEWLIVLRFIMGIGLGAELVVAAGTLAEFVPPDTRGKWVSLLAIITNSGLFAALAAGSGSFRISAGAICSRWPVSARWSCGSCASGCRNRHAGSNPSGGSTRRRRRWLRSSRR
jgi:MFS family permease